MLGLIILAVVALQFYGVQRSIAQKILSSISEKTHTRIEVGSVTIALTNSVVLHNVFVESLQHDTLLSMQTLAADVNLLGLFSHNIKLRNVRIDSLTAHVTRTLPDSSFNFDFLLDALGLRSTTPNAHPDTSTGPGWQVTLGGLSLNGVHGTYDDKVSGLNLRLQLGTLEASIDKFDLQKKRFSISELSLANATASIVQTKESPPDESPSADVNFGIGALFLAKLHFNYENVVTGERYSADLGSSTLLADKIDLPSHTIALKKFALENTNFVAVETKRKDKKAETSVATALPWVISVDDLNLSNNSAHYDVEGAPKTKGLDPNHLRLDGLTMRAENIHFSERRISADLRHTSFREHSAFELRELSGGFALDSLHAQLTDFTVETAGSRIHQNTLLSYSSLSALKNRPGSVNVKANIDDSHVAIADLILFLPSLPIKNTRAASIKFSSQLSGLLRDLQVEEFRGAMGDSTTVDLHGSIRGLPDAETANYDVDVRLLSTGRHDIQAVIADSVLPTNISLPTSMRLSGNFKGTLKKFSVSTVLATNIGSVKGNATFNSSEDPGSDATRWKTDVIAEEFNVGLLLDDPETFGPVSFTASAAGTGFSKNSIKAQLNVQVDKAVVNGYPYRRLSIQGTANPSMFDGKAEIQDSNIAFTFNGSVNTSKKNPTYKFTLNLKGADLHRLNLTTDQIQVAGTVTSDLAGTDINDINGSIDVRNVLVIKNGKRYVIDSLVCASVSKGGQTRISIESAIFGGQFDGTIAPGDLPEVLNEHFAHYFTLQGKQLSKNLRAQAFSFHITLRDPTILMGVFFPDLHQLSAGTIEGRYDSDKRNLNFSIDLPRVDYNDFRIDSLGVKVTSNADLLMATLKMGSIADSTFRATNLQLVGNAGHDSIEVSFKSTGRDGSTKMLLAGAFTSIPDGYKLRFSKDGIVFQNLSWNVPSDNFILFAKNKLVAHNVVLQGSGQFLSLQSTDEKNPRSPLRIEFRDFDLATLSHVVERESGLLGGVLNGNVVLQNLETKMAITSDLTIKDFSFGQRHVGDVALRANNQTENVYEVTLDIAGNGNQIVVQGKYRSELGGNELDLACDFTKVNLSSIEPFTFGNVRRLSGTMTGDIHVTGTRKKPSITGELNFTKSAFNPTFLDTYLHLDNGKIVIDAQGLDVRSFDLVDTLGNKASVSGRLLTEDFRTYRFDLRVHTDKFLVMNKPASRDALYYGTLILDSDVSIQGDQNRPIVTMQAKLDKGSNVAFVLPESELAVEERSGIVGFVDVRTSLNSIMSRQNLITNTDTTEAKPSSIELTSNISVNKDSKLRILIDPIAGDSLVIQGEATLSFAIDPTGKITLTGRYEILKGSYQLSFADVIRRDFAITEGSSLTWFGSPYEADVDITAMYTVKAAALDLIQDQLAGISQEERNKYKQELPIQVYLTMKGKLLKPDIHFKLDLPPDQRGVLSGTVYAKLIELNGQESELNKQVFALLVLGRFIPENPLASAGGTGGLSDFARSSASQILSAQLNRLSEQYIAGANLDVGLDSYQDYSTGSAEGRTQLKLALSKQLFDERVTVQVGGNVDLEGRRSQQNSLNNFAGDLKVLYKLTEDGRWQLKVFRQNSYEGAIDGDITKTGVGVVFMIDFDKLFSFTIKPVPEK
jgi:translocation and assembly module TamB